MKYRVIRDCHFMNRYWTENEIADFPERFEPNGHFEKVKGRVDPEVVVPVPATMSEINASRKANDPKTGMAYKPPEEPQEEIQEEDDSYERKFGRKKPGPKPK